MRTTFLVLLLHVTLMAAQQQHEYRFTPFIQQALHASFSLQEDAAQIAYEQATLLESTLWENPNVELGFSDGLNNAIEYNHLEISQKVPLWNEMRSNKNRAKATLKSATFSKKNTALEVQYRAAFLFHELYFSQQKHTLLQQQINEANSLKRIAASRELAGDISGLERSRIDILTTELTMQQEQEKLRYLTLQYQAQMLLKSSEAITVSNTFKLPQPPQPDVLHLLGEHHPLHNLYTAQLKASQHKLDLLKIRRYFLPELYLYQERSLETDTTVKTDYGFGIRTTIPLWNTQQYRLEMQRAAILKKRIQKDAFRYRVRKNITAQYALYLQNKTYLHTYTTGLLESSKTLYEITTRSFKLGEKSLLELLDAQNLYFQNQLKHHDLTARSYRYHLQLLHSAAVDLLKDPS